MAHHQYDHRMGGRSRKLAYRQGLLHGIERRFARLQEFRSRGFGVGRNPLHPDQARLRRQLFEMTGRL